MIEGILRNQDSKIQSLLFIRDLNCVDEQMRKERSSFYNKLKIEVKIEESEARVQEFLKIKIEEIISEHTEKLFNEEIFDSQKREFYLNSSKTF